VKSENLQEPGPKTDTGAATDAGAIRNQRVFLVDAVRGLAIAGVVLFHIVWDVEFTGLVSGIASHPVWLAFGRLLAGTFMFLVGVSLVLAHGRGLRAKVFARRLGVIALAAVIISIVTWFVFPQSFIFFGILHAITVASLIGILVLGLPTSLALVVAIGFLILPFFVTSDFFNPRALAWIGLFANPPPSNDFVPVFPWTGLTLLGIVAARVVFGNTGANRPFRDLGDGPFMKALVWMGRNSLVIYLVHQPLLLAIIVPVATLVR